MTWPSYASGKPAAIESRSSHGTATVVVSGELDLLSVPCLREHLAAVLRGGAGRLVLDLSGTDFIDCGSAREIARAARLLPPGQRPVIRGPRPAVRRVFQLTGLDAYCEIEG